MQTLINDTKNVTLSDLVERLVDGQEKLIVYYRSRNQKDGEPRLLKWERMGNSQFEVGFSLPTFGKSTQCYVKTAPSIRIALKECLAQALGSREIFVLEAKDFSKLFKVQQ